MSKDSPPDKREVARSLLLRGSMFVHLDPRVEGVVVPPWLRKQPQLVLQMGLDMVVPIVDLRIDRDGVYGTLSFNRSPFTCIVGWDAIFALSGDDGRGMVWPESMPPEILAEVEREAGRRGPVPLAAVSDLHDDDDYDYDDDDDDWEQGEPAGRRGRPSNVIRLQPKLSAVQGGLSQRPSQPPVATALAPAAPADDGVRERDTLELLDPDDGSHGEVDLQERSSPTDAPKGPGEAEEALEALPGERSAEASEPAGSPERPGDSDEEPEPPEPPRGSHLRLVK